MKSKRILFIIVFAILIIMTNVKFVYADSFNVNMSGNNPNYAPGQTVEIIVSLSDIDSSRGLYGLSGKLDYDKNIFETITSSETGMAEDIASLNNWESVTYNSSTGEFAVYTIYPAKTQNDLMKIKLKIKDDAPIGKTTILLSKLEASNGEQDIDTAPVSIDVNIEKPSEKEEEKDEDIPSTIITPSAPSATPTAIPTGDTENRELPKTGTEGYSVVVLIVSLTILLVLHIFTWKNKES